MDYLLEMLEEQTKRFDLKNMHIPKRRDKTKARKRDGETERMGLLGICCFVHKVELRCWKLGRCRTSKENREPSSPLLRQCPPAHSFHMVVVTYATFHAATNSNTSTAILRLQ